MADNPPIKNRQPTEWIRRKTAGLRHNPDLQERKLSLLRALSAQALVLRQLRSSNLRASSAFVRRRLCALMGAHGSWTVYGMQGGGIKPRWGAVLVDGIFHVPFLIALRTYFGPQCRYW